MSHINVTAPINELGYGVAGLNILLALQNYVEVSYWPIGSIRCDDSYHYTLKQMVKNKQMFNAEAPSLRIWHQFDMAQHIGRGPRCGFPIFELNKFTDIEKHHLQSLDHVFTTSAWAANIVRDQTRLPADSVHVASLGVNPEIFKPESTADENYTTFFNAGKWEYRKGHDILVEAFCRAFTPKDKVRLWMLCHNPFLEPERNNNIDGNKEWFATYKNSTMGSKIEILQRVDRHQDVARIMNETDCGVFPSRAEGWNLELLEMMACGKHVIATAYSAHTEFCNNDNCDLIHIDDEEEAYDGKWFFGHDHGHGDWAEIGEEQVDQLIQTMREVHTLKQMGELNENAAGLATARKFSWDQTAQQILSSLDLTPTENSV
jgi:glycosyltransferase involved in cell wall biosynthesis